MDLIEEVKKFILKKMRDIFYGCGITMLTTNDGTGDFAGHPDI